METKELLFGHELVALVVDDSSTSRLSIAMEFQGAGVTILQANNGLDAVKLAREHLPDVMTLDIEMPGLDGYGVCEELMMYEQTMGIPIVMISSRSSEDERLRSLALGAVEYYVKPFPRGALRRFVFEMLERVGVNQNKVVFAVERRRAVRKMIEEVLESSGYQARVFSEHKALREALRETTECDLILIDYGLDNLDGLQLLHWIREQPAFDFLPVVVLADSGERKDLSVAFRLGANEYIRKPFFPEELLARLENQLLLKSQKQQLHRGAILDPLTGLLNRRGLQRAYQVEMRRALREKHGLGALILDLDHFKQVNDTMGHFIGDKVLREVSAKLSEAMRMTDVVARYGGEEFALVTPRVGREELELLSERAREVVSRVKIRHEGEEVRITTSVGAVLWTREYLSADLSLERFFSKADQALYLSKEGGRNRVTILPLGY